MEIFTDVEKRILEATDKNYKWIARDKNGTLVIYEAKPFRDEVDGDGIFDTEVDKVYIFNRCFSDVLFKNVTWENSPIQYRDNELLTPKEKEYLKFVFKPFASDIMYVKKISSSDIEYIKASNYEDADSIIFPCFKKGTMYKGIKSDTKYTLKELGIEYNE